MNMRKKSIESVEVNYDMLYKTCPPKYDVEVKYKDGSVEKKILNDEMIQAQYGAYLNKSGNDESKEQESRYTLGKK